MAKPRRKSPIVALDPARQITRVAAYLRVSTDMQVRSGLGLADQRRQVEAMATVKGWPAPVVYVDEGKSGTKETRDRPALRRLMALVAANEVDAIIVSALDRLSRRSRLTLELSEEMAQHNVMLILCREGMDTTTPTGQALLTMMAAMAQLERDLIAERVRAALAEHSRRDGETGGRLPYGYLRDEDKRLRVSLEQARLVRRIFAYRYGPDRMTLRQIATRLNKGGYHSPQGAHWHHSSVAAVLANAAYYRGGKRGASDLCWPIILREPEKEQAS